MNVFLGRLAPGFDDQGKQPAETFFGRVEERCREAHHFAEGFVIQGVPGSQETVVAGEGQHGPGVHVDESGGEPEVVFQRHRIDDVQHYGRLVGEDLPAHVDMLPAIVHETDHIVPELDGEMRTTCEGQHPAIGLVADDIDQDTRPFSRSQRTFAAIEITFHMTKVTVFRGKGNTNK